MAGVSPLPGGWPTLSELTASDFSYLGQFADYCDRISGKAEKALEELAQEVRRPGGVEWEGAAGEAAVHQAQMDIVKARPFLWGAPDTAVIARRGQDALEAGKRMALDAVDDAERDGFQVEEDYRVVDTQQAGTREQLAERQAEAQAHTNFIRHRVAALVANDQHIAGELKNATAGWGSLTFEEPRAGANDTIVGNGDKHIRPVDHTWKQGPDQPAPGPGRTADDLRKATKDLPHGSRQNYLEVRSPEDLQKLWDWSSANAPEFTPGTPYRGGEGTMRRLPDGTIVGLGPSDEHGSTMDIQYPNGDYARIHVNPNSGGVPEIPSVAESPTPGEPAPRPPEPASPPAAPRAEPPPVAAPGRAAPIEPPSVSPPKIIGGPGPVTGGGGGPGVPGLGTGGSIHKPIGEVE